MRHREISHWNLLQLVQPGVQVEINNFNKNKIHRQYCTDCLGIFMLQLDFWSLSVLQCLYPMKSTAIKDKSLYSFIYSSVYQIRFWHVFGYYSFFSKRICSLNCKVELCYLCCSGGSNFQIFLSFFLCLF